MGALLIRRTVPRYPGAIAAVVVAMLWMACFPRLAQALTTYTTLYPFPVPVSNLQATPSGLLLGADGNFYGTTYYGGDSERGAVFQVTPAGTLTTLHSFSGGSDGAYPAAGLVQDSLGNLYGTTRNGGPSDRGTVFKLEPTGSLTTLHAFNGADGKWPQAGLVQGTDGSLYGTTTEGGATGLGTVFKLELTPTLSFTPLHTFTGTDGDGANPTAGLLWGGDGNLYGTTYNGGASNLGTVFKLVPAPTPALTTLHEFTGSAGEGAHPQSRLLRDTDGNLYGTTFDHGSSNCGTPPAAGCGTVFELKLTPTPTLVTLHVFAGTDGAYPQGDLLRDGDGNLYGTTYSGSGGLAYGTVFMLTQTLVLTTLYTFTGGADGGYPQAGLAQDGAGNFYGTASQGGGAGMGGVVFVLRVENDLTVSLPGTGAGTVTSTPAGISCPGTCTAGFPVTTSVTLAASAATGSTFDGWSGEGCSGTGTCVVGLTQARNVTATFKDATPPTMTHTPVLSWQAGIALPITATITDNINVKSAKLFYRTGTTVPFSFVSMALIGGSYKATIPGTAVIKPAVQPGLQYYLVAQDTADTVTTSATYDVVVGGTVFTDDPLVARTTTIKLIHFTELLAAINSLRTSPKYGLGAYAWNAPAPALNGPVRAAHLTDLRAALTPVYHAKNGTDPTYAEPVAATTTLIKASHLNELRAFVRSLE